MAAPADGKTVTAKEMLNKYYEAKGLKDGEQEATQQAAAGGRKGRGTKTSDVYAVSFKQSKEGWVWKRKEQFNMYDKRWFVLKKEESDKLYYFMSPTAPKPQGFIDLKMVTSISTDTTKKPNSFTINVPKRKFELYTDTEKERTEWMQFITEHWLRSIRKQQRATMTRRATLDQKGSGAASAAARSGTAAPGGASTAKGTVVQSAGRVLESLSASGREGYMWKVGGESKSGKWQKRYFKIAQSKLSYAASPKEAVKGFIDLANVQRLELDSHGGKPNSWSLVIPGRTYYLACDSGDDRDAWVIAVTDILNYFKAGPNGGQDMRPDMARIAAAAASDDTAADDDAPLSRQETRESTDGDEPLPLGDEQIDDLLEKEGLLDEQMMLDDESEESDYDLSVHENFFDEYELGRVLGEGGFAQVLEGRSKKDGQMYAVKWIKKENVDDILYLKREITLMKMLDHECIVKLFEVFEEDDSFFLVMELVAGKELFEVVSERGQYSEAEANNIIRQLVSIVGYLHEMGVAHRDIKPENILTIERDGEKDCIKLIDFGLAKKFKGKNSVSKRSRLQTKVGTPCYLAPEVLTTKEEEYSQAVDMWSVGVISYILLCGYHPFIGADLCTDKAILMRKIRNADYNFDHPNWDPVTSGAKACIRRMVCKDQTQRYSAVQCLQDPWLTGKGVGTQRLNTGLMRATSSFLRGDVEKVAFTPQ